MGIRERLSGNEAIAYAMKMAKNNEAKAVLVNCSGRGDKDMATAGKWFGYLTDEQAAALDVTGAQGDTVA